MIPDRAAVLFTVQEKRLRSMDVRTGPCVPLPGRKHAIQSVHSQVYGETPFQTAALFTVLTGKSSSAALELIAHEGASELMRFSDEFVDAMVEENLTLRRLGDEDKAAGDRDLTKFTARSMELDALWMTIADWPPSQVSTWNKLPRMAQARKARDKHQDLYAWYGPSMPEYVVVAGSGPYPG